MKVENGTMTIEPIERIFDRLAGEVRFNFTSVAGELPRLRKAAEEECSGRPPEPGDRGCSSRPTCCSPP